MKRTNILAEKWRQFQDTQYYVSNYGEIRKKLKNGRWKYLSNSHLDRYGYPSVTLTIGSKQKYYSIHRLVAILFIPNPENKPQVNHINGDKTNNRVNNLEWVTAQENMSHCYAKLHHKLSTPIIRISEDWKEFTLFPSISDAASKSGAGCKEIRIAAKSFLSEGKKYKSGGYYWHYVTTN